MTIGWVRFFEIGLTGIFMIDSFQVFRERVARPVRAGSNLIFLLDLIADHTANCRATNRADRAAASQYSANDCARTGADGRILILLRHAGASCQAKHEGDRRCMYCQFFYRIHM
jgi:hypothetical protein